MKLIYINIILIIACLFCCSCHNTSEKQNEEIDYKEYKIINNKNLFVTTIYEVEIEGHKYLYIYKGGLIHAESCQCLNDKK